MKGIYIVGGYPSRKKFIDRAGLIQDSGFDFLEIGIPFNDSVADGPVITDTMNRVLVSGVTTGDILDDIASLGELPIKKFIMTYVNIPFSYGYDDFVMRMKNHIDGLIIADLPNRMVPALAGETSRIPVVPFATLETRDRDMDVIKKSGAEFVYFVGLRGTTGSNANLTSPEIISGIKKVREQTGKKVIIGFGIKTPRDAETATEIADGYVIGTEAVRRQDDRKEFTRFLTEIQGNYN